MHVCFTDVKVICCLAVVVDKTVKHLILREYEFCLCNIIQMSIIYHFMIGRFSECISVARAHYLSTYTGVSTCNCRAYTYQLY